MAGDVCGSCGTETLDDAHYCHACGHRVYYAPIVVDLYGEDGHEDRPADAPSTESSRTGPLIGIAVAAVVIGGLAVFNSIAEGDPPEATQSLAPIVSTSAASPTTSTQQSTTTEAAAPVLEIAEPLIWHPGPELGPLQPVGIVEYDGGVFLFATEASTPFATARAGMNAWSSGDGQSWESLGTVIEPPNEVTSVSTGADGLVAVGRDADGAAVIWRSGDGAEWVATLLPAPQTSTSDVPIPQMVASSGGIEVIVGRLPFNDPMAAAYEALQELTGFPPQEFGLSGNYGETSAEFVVEGPFGLPLLTISGDELGLTGDDLPSVSFNEVFESSTTVWSSANGTDWHVEALDQTYPLNLHATDSGSFLLAGFVPGHAGSGLLFSDEGVTWRTLVSDSPPVVGVATWGQILIGSLIDREDALAISGDGVNWEPLRVDGILSDGFRVSNAVVSAGDQGIAATAVRQTSGTGPAELAPEAILVRDGYTLSTLGGGNGGLLLRRGDETLITIRSYSNSQTGVVADLSEGTVGFVDPETSVPYVTFTIDELRELEYAVGLGRQASRQQSQILFSSDAKTWSINDVGRMAGSGADVTALQVTSKGVIAAVTSQSRSSPSFSSEASTQIFVGQTSLR